MSRFAKFCPVCRDAGKPIEVYTSHYVKDQPGPNGKVVCPTLLTQPCRYCKKTGHTIKYCPKLVNKPRKVTTQVYKVDKPHQNMLPSTTTTTDVIINMPCIPQVPTYADIVQKAKKPNNDILLKLQKEIELLKKENEKLKKENEELKKEKITPYNKVFTDFLKIEKFSWADEMEKEDMEETKCEELMV